MSVISIICWNVTLSFGQHVIMSACSISFSNWIIDLSLVVMVFLLWQSATTRVLVSYLNICSDVQIRIIFLLVVGDYQVLVIRIFLI